MKKLRRLSSCLIAAFVLMGAGPASALTLGRLQGVAILGLPLNVAVAVQGLTSDEQETPCFAANVRIGETLVRSGLVSLERIPGATKDAETLRIRTTNRVDEPTVSVEVSAGCGHAVARQYALR